MQVNSSPGERAATSDLKRLQRLIEARTKQLADAIHLGHEVLSSLEDGGVAPDRSRVQAAIKQLEESITDSAGDSWFDQVIQGLDERRATQSEGTPLRDFLDQRAASPRRASSHRPNS